jgi:UDP-N-acetylglucosamine 2-epimerase (non-hydrolysing)
MIIHLDAGNRYYNKKMIPEQNELIIDQLATQMVSSNGESVINLMREGVDSLQILELGSLSSDAVFLNLGHAEDSPILDLQGLLEGSYVLVVLSSSIPADSITAHIALFHLLESLAQKISVHVVLNENSFRSLEDIPEINLEGDDGLNIVSGHGFHEMLKLMKNAALVLTDSQSIQEETTVLGVPCLTLGHTTNRPVTLSKGTNLLVGYEATEIQEAIDTILQGDVKEAYPMEGWDGKVASRVLEMILR